MKKILTSIFVLLSAALALSAAPAYPGGIRYTQPDGSTVTIQLHGDEYGHWATDTRGRVLRQDDEGFWRFDFSANVPALRQQASARRALLSRSKAPGDHAPAVGQRHFLVVLVAFTDVPFTVEDPKTAFTNLLNQPGYANAGGTGSARDYYYENSHGKFDPIFDVYGPVTVSRERAYYGKGKSIDDNPEKAVIEACLLLDDEIDFRQYDADGDGSVDMVFMYFAGYGENDSGITDAIWPHMSYLYSPDKVDGMSLDLYACSNELQAQGPWKNQICGIGTACHEFGHTLGLPDLYDTTTGSSGVFSGGLYERFALMDAGCYNNEGRTPPYFTFEERMMLGWVDADDYEELSASGEYTLPSVQEEKAYRIPTEMDGEYFVLECRGESGWDAALPSHGLFVYHLDKSDNIVYSGLGTQVTARMIWEDKGLFMSQINTHEDHPCFYIIPSVDQGNLFYGYDQGGGYFNFDKLAGNLPFPGVGNITTYTAKSWNGRYVEYTLNDIAYAGDVVSFSVKYAAFTPHLDFYSIKNPGKGVYALGSSFALDLHAVEGTSYDSVKWYFDGVEVKGTSVPLTAAGRHVIRAEVSLPGGKEHRVTQEIEVK